MSAEPEKFVPVEVRPEPCADGERDEHLRAFVAAFVAKERRPRARHLLFEAPHKARREMNRILGWIRSDRAERLEGSSGFPAALARRFGERRGVYVDAGLRCSRLTAAEAATSATLGFEDAILSLDAGATALVFHHDGGVLLCTARPA